METELALVMPVYNEEGCIVEVLRSWKDTLSRLGIRYELIVLNDGSKDRTAEALASFAGDPTIVVVNKRNSGHGPTILEGYRMAVKRAPWVFQCDSDDEMRAEHFPSLWGLREGYDALFGIRAGREQNSGRKLISACSRLTVKFMFGAGVQDVNTPYRLMRASLLEQVLEQIPPDTFAPNVIISGAFAQAGLRLYNVPVPHEGRRTGSVSIVKWKLWKAAVRSFWQTLHCRPRLVAGRTSDHAKRRAA
jgi:dolichol-phosphate mannosyltransferase